MASKTRKRPADSVKTSVVVDPRRRKTSTPSKLTLRDSRRDESMDQSLFSPMELFLCQFSEKEDEISVLNKLIKLEVDFTLVLSDRKQLDGCVKSLQKLFHRFRNSSDVICVLVRICKQFAVQSSYFPHTLKELLFGFFKINFPVVKALALSAISEAASAHCHDTNYIKECLKMAGENVHYKHHSVRIESLRFLGKFGSLSSDKQSLVSELCNFCDDWDPRVRATAMKALLSCHENGITLDIGVYQKACKACSDDFEGTRFVALQLIKAMAFKTPFQNVSLEGNDSTEIRLIDSAFIKLCDSVNDWSMQVREQATQFLGEFENVSVKFLKQTLDKKLMSDLKRVKTSHERQRDWYTSGAPSSSSSAWDSGKQLVTAVPLLDLSAEEVSLINQGACGAFIHALEDEFKEVRLAALTSMTKLALKNHKFAALCLDFFVDMFNDEIEEVRLSSIISLRKMSSHLELEENQLDTVLGSLKDASAAMREALHHLLGNSKISSTKGLQATLDALLGNLSKYGSDRLSIWRCLKDLGGGHGGLVASLVPSLLSTHPFLMTSEPNIDDPAYVSVLILVFSACVSFPTIPSLFPSHVYRHYKYLRDTLPDLVPHLPLQEQGTLLAAEDKVVTKDCAVFLTEVIQKADVALSLSDGGGSCKLLEACISDMSHIAAMVPELEAPAHFCGLLWQCQLYLTQVSCNITEETDYQLDSFSHLKKLRQVLMLSYRMQYTFEGASAQLIGQLLTLRVATEAAALLLVLRNIDKTDNGEWVQNSVHVFQRRMEYIASCFEEAKMTLPAPFSNVTLMDKLANNDIESISPDLINLFKYHKTIFPKKEDLVNLRELQVVLEEPKSAAQGTALKFLSDLALSLKVQARVKNGGPLASLAVQVCIPDGQRMIFYPKDSDWTSTKPNEDLLQTCVIMSHRAWTDPCSVELGIVCVYTPDDSEGEHSSVCDCLWNQIQRTESGMGMGMGNHSKTDIKMGIRNDHIFTLCSQDRLSSNVIMACKPISVQIQPM